jgi:hypothetical protein
MAQRPESDYVRVHTYSDPSDDTVTLATIERVIEKPVSQEAPRPTLAKRIKTLIMRAPMTVDEALRLATCYAERKQIPVVYAERG